MDFIKRKKFQKIALITLIISRLITNDGVFINVRRPKPKKQPTEIFHFIKRPAKKGRMRKVSFTY